MTTKTDRVLPAPFGFWAGLAAATAPLAYDIPQILQVSGLFHDPLDRILIFAPSLILAPSFLAAMAAAHVMAPASRKIWSLTALALAILFAAEVSQVYVV